MPHVEIWLNKAVVSTALDAPVEFLFASTKPNLSEILMSQWSDWESRQGELRTTEISKILWKNET